MRVDLKDYNQQIQDDIDVVSLSDPDLIQLRDIISDKRETT